MIWGTWAGGSGGTAAQQNGQLVLSLPANPTFDSQFHGSGINVGTKCKFPGNFDARVDFALLTWPLKNGASASLVGYESGPIEEISRATNSYGDFYTDWPGRGSLPLADSSGSLRIARSNGVLRSYVWHHGQWKQLGARTISGEIWVGMTLGVFSSDWQHLPVSAAFDNFVATATSADCPYRQPTNPLTGVPATARSSLRLRPLTGTGSATATCAGLSIRTVDAASTKMEVRAAWLERRGRLA